jgi:hypothetical protein
MVFVYKDKKRFSLKRPNIQPGPIWLRNPFDRLVSIFNPPGDHRRANHCWHCQYDVRRPIARSFVPQNFFR